MANSLLDIIQQHSAAIAGQQAPAENDTQQAAGLLTAKSGKAIGSPTGDYALSNQQETAANDATTSTMQNTVAPTAAIQQQGLQQQQAAVQQQGQQAMQSVGTQSKFNTLQTQIQTKSMLDNMSQQKGEIDIQRDRAQVDQVATNLRLSNQAYTDQLTLEGSKARLDNQLDFQQALAESIFGEKMGILNQTLGDRTVLDASNNQFKQAMSNMSTDAAVDMMNAEIAQQKQRAVWGAAGSLATAGIGAAASKPSTGDSGATSAAGDAGSDVGSELGGAAVG